MYLPGISRFRIVPFVAAIIGLLTVACISPTPVAQPGKPTVSILAPANNDQVPMGQPTTIQVSAADVQGIARIEVKVDDALVSTTQSPSAQGQPTLTATQVWVFAVAGSHTITAQAFNAAGQASDVAAVTVQAVAGVAVQPSPTTGPGEPAPTTAPPPLTQPPVPPTSVPPTSVPPTPVPPTPAPAKPIVKSFTADPASITAGGSSTLQWEVTGADSVAIDQGVGTVALSGSKKVSPTSTTTYKLTAQSAGGTATKQVQVEVKQVKTFVLYNWWNSTRQDNFATTDPRWSGKVGDKKEGYSLYRIEGLVYPPDDPQPSGAVPLYSWWNPTRKDNFLTTDPKWSGKVGDTKEGYTLVRIEGFIFDPNRAQPSKTVPLYSWWNPTRQDNFATTDPAWSGQVGDKKEGYTLYRIEGYLPTFKISF